MIRTALILLLFASSVYAEDNNIILSELELWNCHEPSKTWGYFSRYGGEEDGSEKRDFEGFLRNGLKFIAVIGVTDGTRSATNLYSDGKYYREGSTNGVFFPIDSETSKRWSYVFKPSRPGQARLMDKRNVYECWRIEGAEPLFETLFDLNRFWFVENK